MLRICCDGAVKDDMWGSGVTWEKIDMDFETETVVECGEEMANGHCSYSPFIFQSPKNWADIGLAETIGIIHALHLAQQFEPLWCVNIVTDRMASIRTLENSGTRKLTNTPFDNCLKYLRYWLSEALKVHGSIKFTYMGCLGYDEKWRPDELSRILGKQYLNMSMIDPPTSAFAAINGKDEYLSTARFKHHLWSEDKTHLHGVHIITGAMARKSEQVQSSMHIP